MKILAVGSATIKDINRQSQVDHWRIYRPMRELAKHTDWQIDHATSFIPNMDKYDSLEQFTAEEMDIAAKKISDYDIVFSSYHPDPTAFTLLKVLRDRTGVQFIMDCDDDMFAINPDNPFWTKVDDEKVYWMQRMIANNDWITTPSEILAKRIRDRRNADPETVKVLPNCIPKDYKHPKFDNSPDIVIGYCGGSSHYADLHESGVLPATRRIMLENKNVRFKSVGMLVDEYIPRGRLQFDGGKRGTAFLNEIFPNLKFDIAIAPLLDNIFNTGKSDIKWQEMTRAGASVVASDIGPYSTLNNGHNALLVPNTEDAWYEALNKMLDKKLRTKMLANAQEDLKERTMENNWQMYKEFFEKVKEFKHDTTHRI